MVAATVAAAEVAVMAVSEAEASVARAVGLEVPAEEVTEGVVMVVATEEVLARAKLHHIGPGRWRTSPAPLRTCSEQGILLYHMRPLLDNMPEQRQRCLGWRKSAPRD